MSPENSVHAELVDGLERAFKFPPRSDTARDLALAIENHLTARLNEHERPLLAGNAAERELVRAALDCQRHVVNTTDPDWKRFHAACKAVREARGGGKPTPRFIVMWGISNGVEEWTVRDTHGNGGHGMWDALSYMQVVARCDQWAKADAVRDALNAKAAK